ncbi:metallophosphoesterase [Paracoccus sp. P2]|uniref:Serine/threonine protein phosphatase n=1 Tax=Paracoccus pantotrophus TaxID=82367 RepID=A0A1I5HEI3_PARPN|nr:metallophosphoesterase [Paracoccus pantotrophus]MDF3853568.1 metallophosphoesterase [Paracoccus pantotrophus]QFG37919.1 serine/threonine protein phosphatase [Paracoccus pantotrophus]QLH15473.1 serine/threonine protein phosphatase [Paracoccus pantotrophus]RDD99198.1 serine/threonine protein phosphatase [Paracoccus pantotrophus]RKS51598.1 serine/threonine protein phosphatase 1 [Paracoccus pantotrophus]
MRTYAIGDIHGHLELLRAAHELIARDDAAHGGGGRLVHVGDLQDRGPDSRGVVDYLMRGQAEGLPWIVLKGNHDRFLPRFAWQPEWIDPGLASGRHWLEHPSLGAAETLASYGVEIRDHARTHADVLRAVPEAHLRWLAALPLWHLTPRALFVHAGIRPGVDLARQTEHDLVWIRKGFLDDASNHGLLVVHGHSPVKRVTHFGNRLAIDTGAAYGGPLSVVVFDETGLHLLTDSGREPIPAP